MNINEKMERNPSQITQLDICNSFIYTMKSEYKWFITEYTNDELSRLYFYVSYPVAVVKFLNMKFIQWNEWLMKLQSN